MRLFLLRTLLAWWMIPALWVLVLPLGWLLTGDFGSSVQETKEMSRKLWNGFYDQYMW